MKMMKRLAAGVTAAVVCVSMLASQAFAISDSNLARYRSMGVQDSYTGMPTDTKLSSWNSIGAYGTSLYVNHFSGNVTIHTTAQSGIHLKLDATYNSLGEGSGELGPHFTTNFNRELTLMPDGVYEYSDVTGVRYHFNPNSEEDRLDETGRRILELGVGGYPYKIQRELQVMEYLNEDGKLAKQIMRHTGGDITTNVRYRGNGKLQAVDNEVYQYDFTYNKSDRIDKVDYYYIDNPSYMNDTVYFEYYENSGNLATVRNQEGNVSYYYDDTNQYITEVGNARISYDSNGRATKVVILDKDGKIVNQESYLYGDHQTIVIDKDGNMTLEQFNLDGSLIK